MPAKKKPAKKPAKKNPTDPNLLGLSVIEAFIGDPMASKKKKAKPAASKKRGRP